jgi:phosphoribosyl-AMP cyclohydrolase
LPIPALTGIKFVTNCDVKQETVPLISFIRDYQLEKPNGYICFTASIHFQGKHRWYKFISAVHIITISMKHLDVIYLLNPEIDEKKIKTMFTNNKRFYYSRTRRFEIKGKSRLHGDYSITIIPINKNCEQETLRELRAKQLN